MAEEDAAIAIYMTEQATRSLAAGAKVADEASKSVTNHKKFPVYKVSSMTT